ncbi:MAG: SAM-dependent methyltransferase [Oscillospiraceae bacterium]|nr:SAM-dependent methyltransferase [Oscillospiraceae bacterium]
MIKELGARLMAVAMSVPVCESLVDCGCDHGHVSIFAAKNGLAKKITASDINRGPLDNAEREISAAGFSDVITTKLTDGLCGIARHDCVIIAGMGGETIKGIMEACPWTKDGCVFVLQPMTKTELLREYLFSEGFSVINEKITAEAGHMYCIMTVTYSGKTEYEPFERYISRKGLENELSGEYIDKIIKRLEYETGSKKKAGVLPEKELKKAELDIKSLYEVRKTL